MDLSLLKSDYAKLEKKYKIPNFKKLDECFEISKLDTDTDTLLRAIRKLMMEKIVNSLSFVEMLSNPMNAPRMYMNFIKNMTSEDRKGLDKIYSGLSELSIFSLERELDYDEKKEAELIKEIFKRWENLRPDFRKILKSMQKPNASVSKRERNYFG